MLTILLLLTPKILFSLKIKSCKSQLLNNKNYSIYRIVKQTNTLFFEIEYKVFFFSLFFFVRSKKK
jgi:hypothetical protein